MIGLIAVIIYAVAIVIAVVGAIVYCKHLSNIQNCDPNDHQQDKAQKRSDKE